MKKNENIFILCGLVLIIALAGCGSDTGAEDDDDDDDDNGDTALTLTSDPDDDGFEPGGTIPDEFACDDPDIGGENTIPKISWSDAPEETQSFALTVIDLAEDAGGTVHALLINLASDTTSIGNNSVLSAEQAVATYLGPCPVGHTDTHTYEATIYALNVEEIEVDDANDTDAVIADIEAAAIESDSIRGDFTAPDAR